MLNILVLFGGRSTEHDVSIITGIQVLHGLNKSNYNVIPVYITKEGEWVKGDSSFYKPETFKNLTKAISGKTGVFISPDSQVNYLIEKPKTFTLFKSLVGEKIDVVFPAFHGRYGEDGAIQGLLELADIAYVGCGVEASAICMNKAISKRVASSIGIPTLHDVVVTSSKNLPKNVKYPVFVKPVRLGSSIGISLAGNQEELKQAVEVGLYYDTKVIIEDAQENAREVNISLLGNDPYELSVCEEPVRTSNLLSFEDKYLGDSISKGMASAKRIIPAEIKKTTKDKIEEYSRKFFSEVGGEGIARIDYLLSKDEKQIYFNEINTMPGSVAFYLWKEKGLSFDALIDKLILLALTKQKAKKKLNLTFNSNILEG